MCVCPFLMKGAQRVYVTTCTANTHASPLFSCDFTGIRRVRVLPFDTASIRIKACHSESHRVTVHAHYFVLFLVPLYPRAPLPTTLGHLYIHKHLYSPAPLPAASAFRRFHVSRGDLSLHRPHPSRSHGGLWEDCKGICHPSLHTTQVNPTSARRQRSGCANRKSSCWDPSAGRCTPFHYIYLDLAGGIITVEAPAGCPGCD